MREYLPALVYSQDEPIADWVCIPLYFLAKLVKDSGTTVVQVGEGAARDWARSTRIAADPTSAQPTNSLCYNRER